MGRTNISLVQRFEGVDRFTTPLYTLSEAARYLDVPASTFSTWAHGYERHSKGRPDISQPAVVTTADGQRRRAHDPSVPFIGLAEGLLLAAMPRRGVPLQRLEPALRVLSEQIGLEHALASRALYTDGAKILYDYAERQGDTPEARSARQLVVVLHGQGVFTEVVEEYLHQTTYGPDNYAQSIRLPQYQKADVVADPTRSFGRPIFSKGGARVEDALQLFWAGENLHTVAAEFGVPEAELEDAVRATSRRAA